MFLAPIYIPKLSKSPEKIRNSSIVKKFPVKFWRLVNSCTSSAVCWGFLGNSVRILKEKFEEEYLRGEKKPFKTVTFSSFIRQLNLYGFRKVVRPVITNEHGQKLNTSLIEYKHPMFLKGHPELLPRIKRNTKSLNNENRKTPTVSCDKSILKRKTEGSECEEKQVASREVKERRTDTGVVLRDVNNQPKSPALLNSVPGLCTIPWPITRCDASTSTGHAQLHKQYDKVQQSTPGSLKSTVTSFVDSTNSQFPSESIRISSMPFQTYCVTYQDHSQLQDHTPGHLSQLDDLPLNLSKKPTQSSRSVSQYQSEVREEAEGQSQARPDDTISIDHNDWTKTESNEPASTRATSTVAANGSLQTVTITPKYDVFLPNNQDLDVGTSGIGAQDIKDKSSTPSSVQIPKAMKTLRGIMVRGSIKGQSVLYLNPRSSFREQPPQLALENTRLPRFKPFQKRPEPIMVYNIPKPVPQTPVPSIDSVPLSATCEEVSSHPLLQPVRKEYVQGPWGLRNGTVATGIQPRLMNQQHVVSTSNNQLPSIPEMAASLCDQMNVQADSPDQDVLSDLSLFKLSSALKDIDAPCPGDVPQIPQSMGESDDPRDDIPSTTNISCNRHAENSTDSITMTTDDASDKSIEVQLIDCPKTDNTEGSIGAIRTPGIKELEEITTTVVSKGTGPRRELFKEKITKRITIPLSGLPQDLFSLGASTTDKHKAVVTIETLEDGRITGHLILPGKELEKTMPHNIDNKSDVRNGSSSLEAVNPVFNC